MYAAIHAPHGADPVRLSLCAADFSPAVEETAPGTVLIAIDGLLHLFGTYRDIASAIMRCAAEAGLAVNVSVASNPDLAVHGARGFAGITLLEPGGAASLPLELLDAPPVIADTLTLWGLRTFGDFAALPEDGVAARLGTEGARLQKLARGEGDRPLVPAYPAPRFAGSMELEDPLTLLEPLSFVLGRLLGDVCGMLDAHGLATHELHLTLALEGAPEHERTLRLPYPMRDPRVFLKLLTLDLERHPPSRPVCAVMLAAEPVNPRVVQHGLFLPPTPEPQRLELTLARIMKIVGEGNVGSAELIDTHRPRAFRMNRFIAGTGAKCHGETRQQFCCRLFRPPLRADVRAPNGEPMRVTARGIGGRVLEYAGPWRTSGDWWRDDAWSRDEWDVALSNGAVYLIYRDRRNGQWFIEGAYD